MRAPRVDYDQLAANYDERYAVNPLAGIGSALSAFARERGPRDVLEVGCGTGHWLRLLHPHVPRIVGADASVGMLGHSGRAAVIAARANQLPFRCSTFDWIYCVNAIHHFDDERDFFAQAAAFLRPCGWLSIVAIDPRLIPTWYMYDYFERAREIDVGRYRPVGQFADWMLAAGFDDLHIATVEVYRSSLSGRDAIIGHPFLKKDSNSLMALLSEDEYTKGLERIEQALAEAETRSEQLALEVEMPFFMLSGQQRG